MREREVEVGFITREIVNGLIESGFTPKETAHIVNLHPKTLTAYTEGHLSYNCYKGNLAKKKGIDGVREYNILIQSTVQPILYSLFEYDSLTKIEICKRAREITGIFYTQKRIGCDVNLFVKTELIKKQDKRYTLNRKNPFIEELESILSEA